MNKMPVVNDFNLNEVRNIASDIVDETTYNEILEKNRVVFFGDVSEKCKVVLGENANANFIDGLFRSSKEMVILSEESFQNKSFETKKINSKEKLLKN